MTDPNPNSPPLSPQREPAAEMVAQAYDQLRALAQAFLKSERANHTLSATGLVHEAYLRLADQTRAAWESEGHFMAAAATMIRRILVDHARGKHRLKRGGKADRITLSEVDTDAAADKEGPDLLDLDTALAELQTIDARAARVVELRYFGGLTVESASQLLGVSAKSVKNDWAYARAWLKSRLYGEHDK